MKTRSAFAMTGLQLQQRQGYSNTEIAAVSGDYRLKAYSRNGSCIKNRIPRIF
jgi:hypothetical protein